MKGRASIPAHSVWDLWKQYHQDRVFFEYFGISMSDSFTQRSIVMKVFHSFKVDITKPQKLTASYKALLFFLRWNQLLLLLVVVVVVSVLILVLLSLVTGLFFLVLLLNQRWSPPLRLQASHCSTFRIMFDIPSIAVFCSESIECFRGISFKFFLKLLATIPVAPIITAIIIHYYYYYYYCGSCGDGGGGGGGGCGGGGGGGGSGGGSGGGQNVAHSEPKQCHDIHFPLEASSTHTSIFRNSTLCAGRLSCIITTLKRKITVKRRDERRIRKQPIRVLLLTSVHSTVKKIIFLCQIISIIGRPIGLANTVTCSIGSYVLWKILPYFSPIILQLYEQVLIKGTYWDTCLIKLRSNQEG